MINLLPNKWRLSVNDPLWFYKKNEENYSSTKPASETLNAVKFGTEYKIYHSIGSLDNWKLVNISKNKISALLFMKKYMKTH